MIGFLVRGRVRIKIRFRVRVGVTFNVSIYHRITFQLSNPASDCDQTWLVNALYWPPWECAQVGETHYGYRLVEKLVYKDKIYSVHVHVVLQCHVLKSIWLIHFIVFCTPSFCSPPPPPPIPTTGDRGHCSHPLLNPWGGVGVPTPSPRHLFDWGPGRARLQPEVRQPRGQDQCQAGVRGRSGGRRCWRGESKFHNQPMIDCFCLIFQDKNTYKLSSIKNMYNCTEIKLVKQVT